MSSTIETNVPINPSLFKQAQTAMHTLQKIVFLMTLTLITHQPLAAQPRVNVAVAANFTGALTALQAAFEKTSEYSLSPSYGSTGQLYAQIHHGAPFDVFLSADAERADKLIQEGLAQPGSGFIYAKGRLALWGRTDSLALQHGEVLRHLGEGAQGQTLRLAIANPKTAPYGRAAQETLVFLGVYETVKQRMITGQSIAQVMQFVASGHVSLGFVAQSQLLAIGGVEPSDYWRVPEEMHQPILQKAVLLTRGIHNPAANAFLQFLRSPEAVSIIEHYGYSTLPDQNTWPSQ